MHLLLLFINNIIKLYNIFYSKDKNFANEIIFKNCD